MKTSYFLIIALFIFSCSKEKEESCLIKTGTNESPLLLKGVSIFNGKENKLIENKDVLIEKGIIKAIEDQIPTSDIYQTIDGTGKILMPGLIDSHVHLSGSGAVPWENVKADIPYNLQAYLYSGITTVYDLGGLAGDLSKIAEEVEEGELIGPTVYNTHIPITVKNSHPIPLTEIMLPWPLSGMVNSISPTIDDVSEAPKLIGKYIKNDIDYVKIICDQIPPGSPEMNFEQLKALIDEAHKNKKKVFVHIGSPQNAIDAVNAGADVLAHGVWRGRLTEEQATTIAASQVPVIYTLSGFKNVAHIHEGTFEPSHFDKKLIKEKVLTPVLGEKGKDVHNQKVMNAFFKDVAGKKEFWENNFKLLYENGAKILVGTDSNLPGTYAGTTYYQEMRELKKYGMSNFDILTGATYRNAYLFLDKPNFGEVEVGKKADLLLLKNNPLENLESIEDPALIIKTGKIIQRMD